MRGYKEGRESFTPLEKTTDKVRRKNSLTGFTLMELVIVIIIIGILAAVAIPQYQKVTNKARWSKVLAVTGLLASSAHRYYLENNSWPSDGNLLSGNPLDITPPVISGITWRVGSGNRWGYSYYAEGYRTTPAGTGYAATAWKADGSSTAGYHGKAPDNW